jgi:hypothetical protein
MLFVGGTKAYTLEQNMFIDANAISNLIEKYNDLSISKGYMPVDLLGVITDLESLITDEEDRMEKMATDWAAQEDGRLVTEDAHHQKLIEQDMARNEWPGGI